MIFGFRCTECGKWMWRWEPRLTNTDMYTNKIKNQGHLHCIVKLMDRETRKALIDKINEEFPEYNEDLR